MRDGLQLTVGVGTGLLLALGTWLGIIAGQLGQPHPSHQWVDAAYTHKLEAAAEIATPKLIVAGGSSAMFGIDTHLLADRLSLPAVNLGVNAGLGLPLILVRTLEAVSPGDRVLLALEYPLYGYNGDINHVMNNYYLSHPEALLDAWSFVHAGLPDWRWAWLVAHESLQLVMGTSLSRVLQGYGGLPESFQVSGTYGPQHLDERGDQTHSEAENRTSGMLAFVGNEEPRRYGAEHDPAAAGWQLLRHFQSQLAARGACLVLVPPAFLFHENYLSVPQEQAFYDHLSALAAQNDLVYAGNPRDFMYGLGAMFDTDFHLISEARHANTLRLLDALSRTTDGCISVPTDP